MACPFLDPNMLARLTPEKREEMREMYERMKKEQANKVAVSEAEVDAVTTDQMMMGMTGGSSSDNSMMENMMNSMMGGMDMGAMGGCPVAGASSGSTQPSVESMQDQFESDPQAFLKRMAAMQQNGGSCPVMSAKHFDPFNEESLPFGYDCPYRSRWGFLLDHRGRLTQRKFRAQRKMLDRLPACMKHTLFLPDDLKKLRDKPFSGLFFNFDKHKEEANRLYGDGDYFEALEHYEQILGVFKWLEFTDPARNADFFKALSLEPILDTDVVVKEKDLGDDECEIEMRTNLVVTLLLSSGYCHLRLHQHTEARKCLDYALELAPIAADGYFRRSQLRTFDRLASIAEMRLAVADADHALQRRPKDKTYQKHKGVLDQAIKNQIAREVVFIDKLVEKAKAQLDLKQRIRMMRAARNPTEEEEKGHVHEPEEEPEFKYPEECRVLDIMREKYVEAIRFFTD